MFTKTIVFLAVILALARIISVILDRCMFPKLTHSYTKKQVDSPITPFVNMNRTVGYFLYHPSYQYTILYSHGNGSDVGHQRQWCWELHTSLHMNVLCYDYIGYGLSTSPNGTTNTPSEHGCYQSAECAIHFLTKTKQIPKNKIILLGHSLGTGVTCELAIKHPGIAGVVLMAPFTSALGVVSQTIANHLSLIDRMKSIDKIGHISQPVYILHGKQDAIINYHSAFKLKEQNPTNIAVEIIENGNHVNLSSVASHNIFKMILACTQH